MTKRLIIIRRRTLFAVCAAIIAFTFSGVASAHGDAEHVKGTVAKIDNTSIAVKTTEGKSVEIAITAETKISRSRQKLDKADIHIGDRVVVHAEKQGKGLSAETIELGPAQPSK